MALERWNSETTLKFIQEFKSHDCLWNQKSFAYKNKQAREAALQKVAEEMHITDFGVPEVKKKMRTLRSTYYQEKKKIQNSIRSRRGSDSLYVPNIPWYMEMDSLLANIDQGRINVENVSDHTLPKDEEENNDLNSEEDSTHIDPEQIYTESSRPVLTNTSKRKRIFRAIGELKKLQDEINKKESILEKEDRYEIFGKSVAIQLRDLSYERSMIAQARIQNILSELSIQDYRYKNTSGSNKSLHSSSEFSLTDFNMDMSSAESDNILKK